MNKKIILVIGGLLLLWHLNYQMKIKRQMNDPERTLQDLINKLKGKINLPQTASNPGLKATLSTLINTGIALFNKIRENKNAVPEGDLRDYIETVNNYA